MNRRTFAVIAPLVAMGLAATACGSSGTKTTASSAATTLTAKIKTIKPGTLTVATELPADAFYKVDPSDPSNPSKITGGFEYDTAIELAKRLNLPTVEIKNLTFAGITNGTTLTTKNPQADVAMSQITITDKRREAIDFSTPYFTADQGLLVRKGTTVTAATLKTLKLGTQADTTGLTYINDKIKPTTAAKTYGTTTDAATAVKAKDIDGFVLDTPILLDLAKASNGDFEVIAQFKTDEAYGVALPKASPNTAAVSAAVAAMQHDGFFAPLYTKYFGGDPAKVPFLTAG